MGERRSHRAHHSRTAHLQTCKKRIVIWLPVRSRLWPHTWTALNRRHRSWRHHRRTHRRLATPDWRFRPDWLRTRTAKRGISSPNRRRWADRLRRADLNWRLNNRRLRHLIAVPSRDARIRPTDWPHAVEQVVVIHAHLKTCLPFDTVVPSRPRRSLSLVGRWSLARLPDRYGLCPSQSKGVCIVWRCFPACRYIGL